MKTNDYTIEKPSKEIREFKSEAKTHRGLIFSLLTKFYKDTKEGINYTPRELSQVFSESLVKYNEIEKHTKATVKLKGWKGISGINVIEKPESFLVLMYQKADQDSDVKEIQKIITKNELNLVVGAINRAKFLTKKEKVDTKYIAEQYCLETGILENNESKPLFFNEKFDWQSFFADRQLHTFLNTCLRVLDYYQVISYRGGKSQVLKHVVDIQTEI